MAKMIPSVLSPEIKSAAEKHIFQWFKEDPSTKDWIVLHSLGISNHRTVIHGETDFFVLAPYMGLFALEVKGGRVSRKNGIWQYTDRYGNTTKKARGPFEQAWDGVHSITDDIKKKVDNSHRNLENVFYGIGVMFPDIEYQAVGCDEEQWQVFDVNDGYRVGDYVRRLFDGAQKRWEETFQNTVSFDKLPTESDVRYIADLLRGDFDKAVAISAKIRDSEEELVRLTEQQYRCIDQISDNKRSLILGGAGTGKTLLAIEAAKNAAAEGKRTAMFCFNRNLGSWIEQYFKKMPVSVRPQYYGTFHQYMMKSIKNNSNKSTDHLDVYSSEFYQNKLPVLAKEAIQEMRDRFDLVIIDEAQDLVKPQYIDVLDVCLHEGFARGQWIMFGDFSRQAIYSGSMDGTKMIDLLEEKTAFARFRLTINCRNTKHICDEITTITGFEPPKEIWSKIEGIPVEYYVYSSREEEQTKLKSVISMLIENHISPARITILSPLKRDLSIVDTVSDYKIINYSPTNTRNLSFSTIQGFKGLENMVIILVDIDTISDTNLMYVALSRARSGLYVIESKNAREEYVKLMMGRIENG
ncbi:MAG: NERD domain-containing protein [Solobacterium sp.]|nr:NERD domain-containing protein [Solobacterium sp.]